MLSYCPPLYEGKVEVRATPVQTWTKVARKTRRRVAGYVIAAVFTLGVIWQQITDLEMFAHAYFAQHQWAGFYAVVLIVSLFASAGLFWHCCVQTCEKWHDWKRCKSANYAMAWRRI